MSCLCWFGFTKKFLNEQLNQIYTEVFKDCCTEYTSACIFFFFFLKLPDGYTVLSINEYIPFER